jgi:beta-glucosidase
MIVINMSGSAVNLDWAKQNANAIVQAWYPGEGGGLAVGRVVAGLANPAGRLPVTFYKDVTQLPAFDDYAMKGRTYRYFEGAPVYSFGYGLSYTHFAYGPIKITPRGRSTSDGIIVETEVTNSGTRAGDEVTQLYLNFPGVAGAPKLALRGFQRENLAVGEKRTIKFNLSPRDISAVSQDGKITVPLGRYKVFVGGGQPGSGLPGKFGTFSINSSIVLPN